MPSGPISKGGKKVVEKIDGEDVELEEVELEDLDALVAETPEEPVDPDKAEVRVVNLTEESTNEVNAFTLKDSEEDDAPPHSRPETELANQTRRSTSGCS